MNKVFLLITIVVYFLISNISFSQVELAPPTHPVYDFLKRMQLMNVIHDYNSSSIPISRHQIADYLKTINENKSKLNSIDKNILKDFFVEFEYDVNKTVKNSYGLLNDFNLKEIFNDQKQKYLLQYTDTNSAFFMDANGNISQRNSTGDSLGKHAITLGEVGFRLRGTLYNTVGFYLRVSNGQKIKGDTADINMSIETYPKLKANTKYRYEKKNYDTYEGYLRYATKSEWLALTIGKESQFIGFGYIDKMFMSDNSVPFSFIRLELKYKALHYYYMYGSLKGDSLGVDISSKNIAAHRLDVNFSNKFRMGFFESLVISQDPFNFNYFNPVSFLRTADYNSGDYGTRNTGNSMLGVDMEVQPLNKFSFQSTLLIDDLDFSTLFNNVRDGHPANDNRFGYQIGGLWTDAFTLPSVTFAIEYTRINPFVYTHRTNKRQYTNWDLPLGHNLPPNSDEIAVKLTSYIYNRLNFKLTYQHQRSANRIILNGDTLIANYGGNIERGDGDVVRDNKFLDGDRVNRDILTFEFSWQPIRQYFLDFKYQYTLSNLLYASKKYKDSYFFLTGRVDF